MRPYKSRDIRFVETIQIEDWCVKVYTIMEEGVFDFPEFYESCKSQLPAWLSMQNTFDTSNHKQAFLVLHLGKEGIFSILNWWVDETMLNTHIFLSNPEKPREFSHISGDGLAPCVWELEVLYHEKSAWVKHILQAKETPDFEGYLGDVLNSRI